MNDLTRQVLGAILAAMILGTVTAGLNLWNRVTVIETQMAYLHGQNWAHP